MRKLRPAALTFPAAVPLALLLGLAPAHAAVPDGIHLYDCACRSSGGAACVLGAHHASEWWITDLDPQRKSYTGVFRDSLGHWQRKAVAPDAHCRFSASGFDCQDLLPAPSLGAMTRRLQPGQYESALVVGAVHDVTRCKAEPGTVPR
jgi:hypothetical protein